MPIQSPIHIVLNGPSESGKSTVIARGLMHRFRLINEQYTHDSPLKLNIVQESFANPMKQFIATALGVKYADLKKNTMLGVLQGYTPREFLIDLSERYMKGRYGDDIFGRLLVHRVLRIEPIPDLVIIDDGGFDSEVDVLGTFRRVIRITRPGKDFTGDSRSYVDSPHYYFVNDAGAGTSELELKLDHLANWCIDQLPAHRRPQE